MDTRRTVLQWKMRLHFTRGDGVPPASPRVGFRKTIRADHRRLQKIYSDEFPELYGQFLGENTIESILPTHVLKMYREMPLPDQTGSWKC